MLRMSRAIRLPRWSIIVALIPFTLFYSFCVYLFILNLRISRDLTHRRWATPTIVLDAGGAEALRLYGADWRLTAPVQLASIPPHVVNAFLAAEDVRFRHHFGIDPIGMARALVTNVRAGGISQGGSTIDQQLVKMKYLSQERTWRRKFVELILAAVLDARMSKDEILEAYLNDVYLGHFRGKPVLGIEEAARLYFDKHPGQLTAGEAALLAGIIRAPNRDTPDKRPDIARTRRDAILGVMKDRGWISESEYRAACAEDVELHNGTLPERPYPFYVAALRAEVVTNVGVDEIVRGGLLIRSELAPAMQRGAERAVRRGTSALAANYAWIGAQSRAAPLQAALLSVDPRSGGIRALVGGSDFHASTLDRTSSMHRQPGSAFKTFAYMAAIASRKVTPATLLLDTPLKVDLDNDTSWEPHNYDERFRGRVTLRQAFEKSLNVPTVRMTEQIGLGRVISAAKDSGFEEDFERVPALPLGVVEVSMRELTAAYTTFPNLGRRTEPYIVREVVDRGGNSIYKHEVEQKKVVGADVAYVMHSLLRGVVQHGTAARLKRYGLGDVAGKTGTTSDYRDAWFVGYSPDVVTSVWVGFDRGEPLRLSSAEAALPIWGSYMGAVPRDRHEPKAPAGVTFRDIDPESGMLWRDGCPGPVHEVFLDGTAPTHACPRGLLGRLARKIFFDDTSFDEPAAITFDQFRRWAQGVDQGRQQAEHGWKRLRKIFGK
jgi:penicillin-binding protein 1B